MVDDKRIGVFRIEYELNGNVWKANILAFNIEDARDFLMSALKDHDVRIYSLQRLSPIDSIVPNVVEFFRGTKVVKQKNVTSDQNKQPEKPKTQPKQNKPQAVGRPKGTTNNKKRLTPKRSLKGRRK